MQVILLKDVERLGNAGEIVKVKDGYGANFLIPRKLAKKIAQKSAKRFLEDEKKKAALRQKKIKTRTEELKAKLEELSCTITMPAGADDKLFGAVTAEMIKEAYSQEGIDIDKRQIQLKERINKLGVYDLEIKLHPEVSAKIKLWVVKK